MKLCKYLCAPLLVLTLALGGCMTPDFKSLGASRRAFFPYVIELTQAEKARVIQAAGADPALDHVARNYVAYRDMVSNYMQESVRVNYKQLTELMGYTKDEARTAIIAQLKQLNYPAAAIDKLLEGL